MEEMWKDIKGYEGKYLVSNLGNVKSLVGTERILKPEIRTGYYSVNLFNYSGKRKHYRIHRLVAEAFIPNPDNLPMIDHKDLNKLNNCVDNLEWCDAKYNVNYMKSYKTKKVQPAKPHRPVICLRTGIIYPSAIEAQRQTGIRHISEVCSHKRHSAGGMNWMWYEEE